MRDFKKERGRRQQYSRMALGAGGTLLLLVLAFFAVRGAWDMYGKFTQAASARADEEARLAELKGRHQAISTDVSTLQSDRGIEAQVRERYGVARPGEGEIDIVRQASTTLQAKQQQNWFDKLWHLLFVW